MADEQIVTLEAPFMGESWSDTPPAIVQDNVENNTGESAPTTVAPDTIVDDGKKKQ